MTERGPEAGATCACWCGRTIRASGDPRLGLLTLRHGEDRSPLVLHADSLIRRVAAGDPAVLGEPPIRGWLRGYHAAPE